MKTIILTIVAFILGILVNAQVSENRTVENFTGIEASNGVALEFSQGSKSIKVETDSQEKLKNIVTKVENGVLKIYSSGSGENLIFKKLKVTVSNPSLTNLKANSGVHAKITELKGNKFNLDLNSGVSFNGNLNISGEVKVDASAGVSCKISGNAAQLTVETSSGTSVNAKELKVENATVSASAASSVNVNAKNFKKKADITSSVSNN